MRPSGCRKIALSAAVIACAACSDQAAIYSPSAQPDVLLGEFGTRAFQVTAKDTAAVFTFACGSGVTGPLRRSVEGDLEASGTLFSTMLQSEPMYVIAYLNGDILSVTVYAGATPGGAGSAFMAHRDVPGDFSGIACAQ